jgi:hypothetical protein
MGLIYLYQGCQRVRDGRSDFYRLDDAGLRFDDERRPNWKDLLDRYKIEVVLTPAGSPPSSWPKTKAGRGRIATPTPISRAQRPARGRPLIPGSLNPRLPARP